MRANSWRVGPGAASLVLLAPFLYSFFFLFPRGDDFDEATRAMFIFDLPGGLYEAGREWLTWSGRYTYHFLAVFLGAAGENRILYGLVCAAAAAIQTFALYLLARKNLEASRSGAASFALAGIFAFFCFYKSLTCVYLLTDALSIILQGALYLLFFTALFSLWQKTVRSPAPASGSRAWTLMAGIAAIGCYEYAALAVFWTSLFFLCWIWLEKKEKYIGPFLKLFLFLGIALAASLLAPGNFARSAARMRNSPEIWETLRLALEQWGDMLLGLAASPWPLAAFCLAGIAAGFAGKKIRPALAAVFGAGFLCFSLSVAIMQAQSDAPLASAPKFFASLEVYGAFALGAAFYNIFPSRLAQRKLTCPVVCALLLGSGIFSFNFQNTAFNALNGDMVYLANFMERRRLFLHEWAKKNAADWPPFGLAGEIVNPGARAWKPGQEVPGAAVQAFPRVVFPVYLGEALNKKPDDWPNTWAAWMYGVARIAAEQPAGDASRLFNSDGIELAVPEDLARAGLKEARLVASRSQNDTFDRHWLLLAFQKKTIGWIGLYLPAPLERQRLAPVFLQKIWLENILAKKIIERNMETQAGGVFSPFLAIGPDENLAAIPLGYAHQGGVVYVSADGRRYHRLGPYL